MASAFGGLMYQQLQTKIYNDHIDDDQDNNCYGKSCYEITFLVSTFGMVIAIVINIYLSTRFKVQKDDKIERAASLTKFMIATE